MKKALSGKQVLTVSQKLITLGNGWDKCLGGIPKTGVAIIWGHSGNGKSETAMTLAYELAQYGKVLYVAAEEGYGASIQQRIRRCGMADLKSRFIVTLDTFDELMERLNRREKPKAVFIDSPQALRLKKSEFDLIRQKYGNSMLIVFVSQTEGKEPKGKTAQEIKFYADIKIFVSGFKAFSHGRFYGETGEKIIWEEGARRAYGRDKKEVEDEQEKN